MTNTAPAPLRPVALENVKLGQTVLWKFRGDFHSGKVTAASIGDAGRPVIRVNGSLGRGPGRGNEGVWLLEDVKITAREQLVEALEEVAEAQRQNRLDIPWNKLTEAADRAVREG